jgi:hypothetical protein
MVVLVAPLSAAAQSAYVGASLLGDIVRESGATSVTGDGTSAGGEAIGFTLRVGTPLGAQWGVEAEFARPSEIEEDLPDVTRVLTSAQLTFTRPDGSVTSSPGGLLPTLLPPLNYRSTVRNVTFSTSAWIRQDFTARSSLVYHAGLGFVRTERTFGFSFDPRILAATALSIFPADVETTLYSVKPFVGIEGRLGLGEHAQLVPGIRLHGVENGWLLRPSVGVNWMF